MADQPSAFQFDDIPLEDARRMGRGPRMEPMLYETLRQKLQSLCAAAMPPLRCGILAILTRDRYGTMRR